MPMKTTCDSLRPSLVTRRAASIACSSISCARRLRPNGNLPVAQNGHPTGQPACDEMQSVVRSAYRITTASTVWPPSSSNSVLVVSPESASDVTTGVSDVLRNASSSFPRSALGTSLISSNEDAPRATQPMTWRRRKAGSPWPPNLASSSVSGSERIAGLGTRLRYGLEQLLAPRRARKRMAFVDQLLQVGAHRHLGRDHQLLADPGAVNALGQLARGAAPAPQLG